MSLVLSEVDQARLAMAARTVLGSFDSPFEVWGAEILDQILALLDADAGSAVLECGGEFRPALARLPDSFSREYLRRRRAGVDVVPSSVAVEGGIWSARTLAGSTDGSSMGADFWSSCFYRELLTRYGIEDAVGIVLTAEPPAAEEGDDEKDAERPKVLLTCYSRQRETDGMGERGAGILGLLRPALATGFAARLRRRRMRRVVEVGFDSARDGLLLTTLEGRALFANEAMSDLLRRDPDGTSVQTVIGRVVRMCGQLVTHTDIDGVPAGDTRASTELRTGRARYQIRGQLAAAEPFAAGTCILISVLRQSREPPSPQQLHEWWQLTPQEARVALLLARGMTNVRIALELELKPSTVRHYVESIFVKLEAGSRAEAAYKILCH